MECNREEGLRAGRIVLTKLKNKDFRGAQRIALKAQRLYPELENLPQLLAVCVVHCAAEAEINGDLDWYGILQVEATVDDEVIRKQYCKLACLLHPNKNTLPGAKAAFKLVCIAHKILCDHMMRFLYDIKTHVSRKLAKKATYISDSTHANKGDAIRHRVPSELILVFHTICPHCQKQFLFYRRNIFVRCDDCGKTFFAFKMHEATVPLRFLPSASYNAQVSPEMFLCHPNQWLECTKLRSTGRDMDYRATMNATQADEHVKCDDRTCNNGKGNFSETTVEAVQLSALNQINSPVAIESITLEPNLSREDARTVSNANAARSPSFQRVDKKKQDDSICSSHSMDSCSNKRQRIYDSVSLAKSSDDKICNENAASAENRSSDHCPSKFDNPEEGNTAHEKEEGNTAHEECQQIYRKHTPDISAQRSAGNSMIACTCPDIFNFETYRDASRFAVGQIWALYDKFDVMPRFYGRIMHFDAHNHKIHLAWLEHDATNKEEEKWTDKKLPVACGSFRLQPTVDTSQDRFMFSHTVAWTKGTKASSYDIYPNKGEVWALYKGWSMQWSSDKDDHKSYDYEVVEVLCTMSADDGATVIPLVKIKGFVSLFARAKGMSSFFIPSSELLRFSHSISFYRTNGNEKMGVPRGFLELDTACLPADLDAAFSSVTLVSYMFLGNMTGCVFADFTTESADNKMDYEDEPIARKENPLEQDVCHSISTDDTDNISSEQNTPEQKMAHCANELGREYTYTVPNAAGLYNLQMLGKRKHDHCDDRGHRRDSCINKGESKDKSLSDADSTADKMYNNDAAVTNNQAAKHVPDTMDRQGEGNATHKCSQQRYKKEATGIAKQMLGNPGIAYECTGSIGSRDYCNNDRQRKYNSLADNNSVDDKVCNDNVAGGQNQAAEPVPSALDSQDEGNATQEGSQNKKDEMDIANHMHCNHVITYGCSDFFDFGMLREVNRIAVNQIWAIYDNHDFMPRNYAQINKVDASNNIVQLTWLEHNTKNLQETRWTRKELPVAYGNFCLGETCVLPDPSMCFSHEVSWVTGTNRNLFEIHPKKGEIWALYKESSLLRSRDTDNHQSVDYDVVEVSDDSMSVGIIVSPLVRIEGFVNLFAESKDKSRILIPSSELLRFSHSIPCYRTNGTEKIGLRGLLELDTAALPCDLATGFPTITLDSFINLNKNKISEFIGVIYPDSEFYNFDEDRSCEKFERGQIWALYRSTDTFPNLYGWIDKVEKEPFKVHLTWLEACPQVLNKHWLERDIPVSCGNFVIRNSTTEHCETCAFSHLVVSRCEIGTKRQVNIVPKVGEVWAIYMNWAADSVPSSKDRPAKYAIGEIKMCTEATTLFAFLTKVNGHLSVFKHDVLKRALEVPWKENLRFSHRIPSFRLTKENGGKLRGFYELDPAAVPDVLL